MISRLSEAEVLRRLRAVGIEVANEHALIPKTQHDAALAALGIDLVTGQLPPQRQHEPALDGKKGWKNLKVSDEMEGEAAGMEGEVAGMEEEAAEVSKETKELEEGEEQQRPKRPRKQKSVKDHRWEIVGHRAEVMTYLTAKDVEQIHWSLVREFERSRDPIAPTGVRSDDLLESAVFRVHTAISGELKYPTIAMVGAAYLHAIIANHAFHNGNKRTALVSMLVFLDLNGYVLEIEEDPLFEYLIRIASHDVGVSDARESRSDSEMIAIAKWVSSHSRPLVKEERPLKFHQFRAILSAYQCSFEHPKKGNRVNIRRGNNKSQVCFRNAGSDVELNTIRKVRKDLELTDEDGYDSTIFYNKESRIPGFIQKYRRTLQRLAKV